MTEPRPHAGVAGGSLSGLCGDLALAHAGWTLTIAERGGERAVGRVGYSAALGPPNDVPLVLSF